MSVITAIEAIPLAARFRQPFRFGNVVRSDSANVVVRLTDDAENVGYGEACPVPQLTDETQESVVALVEGEIRAALLGRSCERWRPLLAELRTLLARSRFTLAALDTAVLDLVGKARGVSVSELLGGRYREAVEVHGSVGWFEDPAEMAARAAAQAGEVRVLKLYVGPGRLEEDLARLRAVRESVGVGHPFLVDVNGMWSAAEALAAAATLRELGVVLVEQPVSGEVVAEAAEITRAYRRDYGLTVVTDESVRSAADVLDVRLAGHGHAINVGVSKLGGVTASLDVATVVEAAGLEVLLGSVVELGIATTASLHLAAVLPRLEYPSYLIGPLEYERQITWPHLEPVRGMLPVPEGPGLGIDVDADALSALDARRNGRPALLAAAETAGAEEEIPS